MRTMTTRGTARVAALCALAVTITLAGGCGSSETYGEPLSGGAVTSIGDILTSPDEYAGSQVRVEGEIALECSTGCWFNLQEGDATIHVDLKPSGLAIPQLVGRNAVVEGKVVVMDRQLMIIGKGVEIL
jgi:hypothetical protein